MLMVQNTAFKLLCKVTRAEFYSDTLLSWSAKYDWLILGCAREGV